MAAVSRTGVFGSPRAGVLVSCLLRLRGRGELALSKLNFNFVLAPLRLGVGVVGTKKWSANATWHQEQRTYFP